MWAGRSFRVILHTERLQLSMTQTRDRIVVQIEMRYLAAAELALGRNGESMVVRGDFDLAGLKILHRLIAATMTETHLLGPAAQRQGQNLMSETDAKNRYLPQKTSHVGDGIIDCGRITRSITQEGHPPVSCP